MVQTSLLRPHSVDKSALSIMARLTHSGVETMLRAGGPIWRERGWVPHILSTGDEDEGPFAQTLRESGYVVHHVAFRRHVGFFLDIWRFLAKHRFDVVHIHCERANVWLGLLSVLSGARTYRMVNSIFAFTGELRLRRWFQRLLLRKIGVTFTAPTPDVIEHERWRFANPCRLLPNWIDDVRFPLVTPEMRRQARGTLGVSPDQFVLFSAGRCQPIKNHGAIIEAMALLPDTALYLHAGEGPLEAEEMALAERLGVSARIRFLGVVDAMSTVLAATDVFVMPSLAEGLGLAAVEALASGIPCVLSRVDGLSELMSVSRAGRWCGPDGASVAAAVREVMESDPDQRRSQARLDAEEALRLYSCRQGMDKLFSLYEDAR